MHWIVVGCSNPSLENAGNGEDERKTEREEEQMRKCVCKKALVRISVRKRECEEA